MLRKALLDLAKIHVSLDLTGEKSGHLQGCMGYMPQAIIEHSSGLCRYSYPRLADSWTRDCIVSAPHLEHPDIPPYSSLSRRTDLRTLAV